jgi:hypothetical protein
VVPYALWALLAQNVVEQPRHLAPLVIALLLGLSLPLSRKLLVAAVAVLAVAGATLPLLVRARREPPAAAQAAAWVDQWSAAHARLWLSEVDVDLERVDRLPAHNLVTSELETDPLRAGRLVEKSRFCRDPRLDRQQPCLTLFEYCITPECKKY